MSDTGLPFSSLALDRCLTDVLSKNGFLRMSPVQEKTIPFLLRGENVLSLSPTGTGKTLAYAAPLLEKALKSEKPTSILLFPTVALLDQVHQVLRTLARDLFGEEAVKALRSRKDFTRGNPRILLSTPHLYPEILARYDTSMVQDVVLDEGDMLVYDGFSEILSLLSSAIRKGSVSFFSASLPTQKVREVTKSLRISNVVDVRDAITAHGVRHHFVFARSMGPEEAFLSLVRALLPTKMIVFVSRGDTLPRLSSLLKKEGIEFLSLQGQEEKRDIRRKVELFRRMPIGILLATDYLSRGIDVPDCKVVLSYDLPRRADYYFHRAGRTGRFGTEGDSYVLVLDDEESLDNARRLSRREESFDLFALTREGLKSQRGQYLFKSLGKKDQSNERLQKQIRHAVNETKSKKVKPNYKKKVQKAVDLVKLKHRKKVVLTNIARKGGKAQDYHEDERRRKR